MIDAIETNCNLFSQIDVPVIRVDADGNGNGIAFMLTPIGQETRYFDGKRNRTYAFQLIGRHTDQLTVLNALFAINRYIDGLNTDDIVSKNGTFEFTSAIVTSVPNLVQVDNHGFMYVSNYQAELLLI